MPAEQVAERSPGHAVGTGLVQGAPDLVGDRVAQHVAEDVRGGGLAVLPDGKPGLEVGNVDAGAIIEQGIDQGETDHLRFATSRDCSKEPRLAGRQRAIDSRPLRSSSVREYDTPDTLRSSDDSLELIPEMQNLSVGEVAAERQFLRAP